MIEIRWHGRGGQGSKTAALLLADVAFSKGMYVQGFPEYGPERMGAPITAYNRLDIENVSIHSNVYNPDIVVVVDESLIDSVDIVSGLKKNGALLINSQKSPKEVKAILPDYNMKLFTIDAQNISQKNIGKNMPNTALLAAVVKITGIMGKEEFYKNMRESLSQKFSASPEILEGNMKAVQEAWEGVTQI